MNNKERVFEKKKYLAKQKNFDKLKLELQDYWVAFAHVNAKVFEKMLETLSSVAGSYYFQETEKAIVCTAREETIQIIVGFDIFKIVSPNAVDISLMLRISKAFVYDFEAKEPDTFLHDINKSNDNEKEVEEENH